MLLSALALKMIGVVVSSHFLRRGWSEMNDTHHHHVATSHVTSPLVLLLWRLSMLAFTSGVLYLQVSERGPRAFRFFTVWNWTAIIIYFLLASIASAVSVFGGEPETGRRRTRSTAKPRLVLIELSRRADFHPIFTFSSLFRLVRSFSRSTRLSKAVATAFHALTPMTLYIDIITWTILVPALMKTPDLERRRHWENVMFSFISYAQHGLNALIMGVEMLINNIPHSENWSHGVVCMWNVLFALWALFFFFTTGQALYPFLDFSKHPLEVWVAFLLLLASSLGSSFFVQRLLKMKWRLFAKGSSSPM